MNFSQDEIDDINEERELLRELADCGDMKAAAELEDLERWLAGS